MDRLKQKGRGAVSNASGRYELESREAFDDGWSLEDAPVEPWKTIVGIETARKILSWNESPDVPFDRSINTYRGCEHGCIYCFARPNHAYVGLSPGLDFETRIFVKERAAALLEAELRKPSYKPAVIMLGGVTDVYQPLEREHKQTRACLEVLHRFRHPFAIVTKSALVQRDLDIIAPMAAKNLAKVAVSLTTLDRKLSRSMEPRAAAPEKRLETIRALAGAGVPVAVMTAPMIPGLNDHELEALLEAAYEAGAREAGYVALRLPLEIKDLFQEWLTAHAPARASKVMRLVREMRGGKDYDPKWGERMRGAGPYALLLAQRFKAATARIGYHPIRSSLDSTLFRRPDAQPGLFDEAEA